MTMRWQKGVVIFVIVVVIVALVLYQPISLHAYEEPAAIRLIKEDSIVLTGLTVQDAAMINEDSIIVVGRVTNENNNLPPGEGEAKGAIVDLVKKTTLPFTNDHKAPITCVSVSRNRIITGSTNRDPVVRFWDVKLEKRAGSLEIGKSSDTGPDCLVAAFHKSDRIAVTSGEKLFLIDLLKPDEDERLAFPTPPELKRWFEKPAISPDDSWIACFDGDCQLHIWKTDTRKFKSLSLLPKKVEESERWLPQTVRFGPSNYLIALRQSSMSEVPESVKEKDVPLDRRSVVRVGLPKGDLVQLGMGHTEGTFSCAIDPTGSWLALAGSSRPDKKQPNSEDIIGELRIYRLSSGKLTYREQISGLPLSYVTFSPSGKRLITSTLLGTLRWWKVE